MRQFLFLQKKAQAKKLIITASAFTALFMMGVVAIVVITLSSQEGIPALTTEDQLKADVNTFGLGVINYTKSKKTNFNIEPEQAGELRVTYLPIEFNDPRTEESYAITTEIPEEGELQYILGGVCNADDSISQSGESAKVCGANTP